MRSKAVRPTSSWALGSAPASSRACTTAGILPCSAAKWRGLDLNPSIPARALGSAPASNRACSTAGVLLCSAALWMGAHQSLSRAFGAAPSDKQRATSSDDASLKNRLEFQAVQLGRVAAGLQAMTPRTRGAVSRGASLGATLSLIQRVSSVQAIQDGLTIKPAYPWIRHTPEYGPRESDQQSSEELARGSLPVCWMSLVAPPPPLMAWSRPPSGASTTWPSG